MQTIGDRLRQAREQQLITQSELSMKAGVQIATISRIENNRLGSAPRISTVRKLAGALDVDPRWLMRGTVEDAKKAAA